MKLNRLLLLFLISLCSLSVSARKSSEEIAIARAKAVFIATANGDVAQLKRLMTPEFYEENYPYSDARVREILLSVPAAKRKSMIDNIQNKCKASTLINRAGDVITVILTNTVTNKEFTVQLLDEKGNNDWIVFNYWY